MVVPAAEVVALVLVVHAQDFGILLCHPRRTRTGGRSQDDMDAALALKNKTVTIRRKDAKLPKGVYFDQELIGLTARNAETGEEMGTLEEVMDYPAHKVYAVRGGKDEYLIPAVPAFVKSVDIKENIIEIHVWEGMGSHEN